ncbi:DUF5810 domain-containing protein [Salinibaculum rarum]|uniref:DUF5810 domain-containing protein n=1 Tax=Salinibaculum rarum TaxID=3058903 RepID=UPI00265F3193|nr:DUF5810 domain-containing protein [Salinibaculum sp. KK48]
MGYVCPVCEDPQADTIHLANHLAFTALVRGGDHEEWLDEHVPDWESMDEETLGEHLTVDADETDYPQVFEDTTDQPHDHEHDHGHAGGHDSGHATQGLSDAMLADAREELADEDLDNPEDVLAEARELTRKRHEQRADEDDSESE